MPYIAAAPEGCEGGLEQRCSAISLTSVINWSITPGCMCLCVKAMWIPGWRGVSEGEGTAKGAGGYLLS